MSSVSATPHRMSTVGSWLRPDAVKEARAQFGENKLSKEELRKVEDENIADVVKAQRKVGIKDISDGEYRRTYFHLDFLSQLGGISVTSNKLVEKDANDAKPPSLAVTGKIQHTEPIELENFKFLQSQIDSSKGEVVKMAIPSATMAHFRGGRASIDIQAYPNMDDFFEDLAAAYRKEIKSLTDAGCKFIQLDDTNLAYLCDPKMREAAAGRGEDLNTLPRQYAQLFNACVRDVPKDVTVAIHLCRGNYRSTFFAEGGYEPIAQVLFQELNANAYYLEWENERSGGLEPLKYLPKGKKVILGFVSSKLAKLEDKQTIINRIKEAAQYAPLEQLGLSPQCGFASTHHGNDLSPEEQWAKMNLIREIVEEVWGEQ